jgi:hypothetical protein
MGLGELLLLGGLCAVPVGGAVGLFFLVRQLMRARQERSKSDPSPPS